MPDELNRSFVADMAAITTQQPDAVAAVLESGAEFTYRQFDAAIDRTLAFLFAQGVPHGGTVMALMPNSLETVLVFLACLKGGLRFAPLPCTATGSEVDTAAAMVSPSLILLADPVSRRFDETLDGRFRYLRLNVDGSLNWLGDNPADHRPGGGQLVVTTSGSTGTAKAILIDGDRLWSSGCAFARFHGLQDRQVRFWNYLPMSYLGGLFNLALIPLAARGAFLINEPFSGKTFLTFWPIVERFGINALWLVPSIVRGLIALAERTRKPHRDTGVKTCFVGTAPIALVEKQKFSQIFGIEMLENFALSETTFITSETYPLLNYRTDGSVGTVLPYAEMRLIDTLDADEERSVSEIAVRSPFLMLGYLRADGSLDPSRDADGFLRTGDLGYMSQGQLVVAGRTREIIKKGGYLILLPEIERLVETHPAVTEAAAVPVPHSFYGESYDLYLRLREGSGDDRAAILVWLQERLVRHKWPERIAVRSDFPRTPSGKIRKGLIAKEEHASDK